MPFLLVKFNKIIFPSSVFPILAKIIKSLFTKQLFNNLWNFFLFSYVNLYIQHYLNRWLIACKYLVKREITEIYFKIIAYVDSNSNQWQCSIIVTCLLLYHVTSILLCHWREFSRDTDVYLTYIRLGTILTQFYVNFSRQEHQIDVL